LTHVALISVLPAENVSNTELEADLRKRLESRLFSLERIAILEGQMDEPGPTKTRITIPISET